MTVPGFRRLKHGDEAQSCLAVNDCVLYSHQDGVNHYFVKHEARSSCLGSAFFSLGTSNGAEPGSAKASRRFLNLIRVGQLP